MRPHRWFALKTRSASEMNFKRSFGRLVGVEHLSLSFLLLLLVLRNASVFLLLIFVFVVVHPKVDKQYRKRIVEMDAFESTLFQKTTLLVEAKQDLGSMKKQKTRCQQLEAAKRQKLENLGAPLPNSTFPINAPFPMIRVHHLT
jgi:hypothetical protein